MGESPTLTIRLDEATKKRLENEAKRSDQTVTEYVTRAMKMRWEGACPTCGRDMGSAVVQPPGMTAAFTAWTEQQTSRRDESPFVVLVTNEPMGNRVYAGTFYKEGIHSSYITLSVQRPENIKDPVFIPVMRQYIIAWHSQDTAELLRNRLAQFFRYEDVAHSMFRRFAQEPRR